MRLRCKQEAGVWVFANHKSHYLFPTVGTEPWVIVTVTRGRKG